MKTLAPFLCETIDHHPNSVEVLVVHLTFLKSSVSKAAAAWVMTAGVLTI
jgi:hypothetical protein